MNTKTILIVEDDSICLRVLEHVLRSQGYTVVSCGNGVDAVARILCYRPDIVLLDLGLPTPDPEHHPRFDGFTVLDWLRRIAPSVPAIVVSGQQAPGIVKRVMEAGAIGFLEKPVVPSQLVEVVRVALKIPHREHSDATPESPAQGPPDEAPARASGSVAFATP